MGISAETTPMLKVVNPTTGQQIAEVPITPPQAVPEAVRRARAAFQHWKKLSVAQRARYLYAARDWIVDHQDEIIKTICAETGKPRTEASSPKSSIAAISSDSMRRTLSAISEMRFVVPICSRPSASL
jgi:acyl-CoA reductase-like NAD-dependent aldehyde dehydrogenase